VEIHKPLEEKPEKPAKRKYKKRKKKRQNPLITKANRAANMKKVRKSQESFLAVDLRITLCLWYCFWSR